MLPNYNTVPAELKEFPHWVCRNAKKEPINPKTGNSAKSNDAKTWATFIEAVQYAQKHDLGIGFQFGNGDRLSGVVGIDIDHCRNHETGALSDLAIDIISMFAGCYVEISPSGTGIHILPGGELPKNARHKIKELGLEVYDRDRYFTISGDLLPGAVSVIRPAQNELNIFYQKYFSVPDRQPTRVERSRSAVSLSDTELINKILKSKQGSDFQALFNGDTTRYNGDDSAADLALCNMLAFWTGRDASRMDALFRQSGLYREKWERADYRSWTIQKAINDCQSVYDPKYNRQLAAVDFEQVYPISDMIETLEKMDADEKVTYFNKNLKSVLMTMPDIEREIHIKSIAKIIGVAPNVIRSEAKPPKPAKQNKLWMQFFELNQFDENKNCANNFLLVLQNDDSFKGLRYNEFSGEIEIRDEIINDDKEAMIRVYIDRNYDLRNTGLCRDALVWQSHQHCYHPVREYFKKLAPWDGTIRAETIFIDCLGADDTPYTRHITKMLLKAAYARAHNPGIKFDLILVLRGAQGIGKSVLISKLGMEWSHSSLKLTDMRDSKIAGEKIRGYWLIEIPELAGMSNADLESVKAFITAQEDVYRSAYDRKTAKHKRQSVMIATTNSEYGYLRDESGNRRFIDIYCTGGGILSPLQLDRKYIDQMWAEVRDYYSDVPLYLSGEMLEQAAADQLSQIEQDPREDLVATYLEKPIPVNWYKMSIYDRQAFLDNRIVFTEIKDDELKPRQYTCVAEIYEECFHLNKGQLQNKDRAAITRILMRLGWQKFEGKKRCGAYGSMRGFERP